MGIKTLFDVKMLYVALVVTLALVFVVNKFRPKNWLPDNTLVVLAGITLGIFMQYPSPTDLYQAMFATVFYEYLLPPIVFAASLNQTRHTCASLSFALGTVVFTTLFIGKWMELYIGDASCLMMGCLLWGVILAPVSARYAIASHEMHEVEDLASFLPSGVNAWLQSETQLSGPIALVLFSSLMKSEGLNASPMQSLEMFAKSLLGSLVMGALFGLFASLTLKAPFGEEREPANSAYRQAGLVVVWAAASYVTAKYLSLSAVGALFATGVVMSNLAFAEVSAEAKYAAKVGSASVGAVFEGLILLYLSLSATSSPAFAWENLNSHMLVLVVCLLGRLLVSMVMVICFGACCGNSSLVAFMVGNLSGVKSVVPFVLALRLGQVNVISSVTFVTVCTQIAIAPLFSLYLDCLKPAELEHNILPPPPSPKTLFEDYGRSRFRSNSGEITGKGEEDGYQTFA
ncbi:hypothetical protein BASA81_010016 [Batrachochytrium salamandrivorans]|nr:hypothetical protein BASA81_010016 [Batrachochytrium salamandrivorans]